MPARMLSEAVALDHIHDFIQVRDELSEEPSGPRRRTSYPHWQRGRGSSASTEADLSP